MSGINGPGRTEGPRAEDVLTRRSLLRGAGAGAVLLATPALLAACGSDDGGAAARTGTQAASDREIAKITWGMGSGIRGTDIVRDYDAAVWASLANSLEGLVALAPDGSVEPRLAESWEQTSPTTYVYVLREGVTYWDGSPVSIDDVIFNLDRIVDPRVASPAAAYFGAVESFTKTGERELTVKLRQPDFLFQYTMALSATWVTKPSYIRRHGEDFGTSKAPAMGTGPMRLTAFKADRGLEFERYAEYKGTQPKARKLEMRFITDSSARQLAMRSGELQGAWDVESSQVAQWEAAGQVIHLPDYLLMSVAINTASKPWDDIHVRRAFAHCFDKPALSKALGGPGSQPAESLVARDLWGGMRSADEVEAFYASLPAVPFDVEAARAELAKSSVPEGFSATLNSPRTFPDIGKAVLNASTHLEQIGIDVTVRDVTEEAWIAEFLAKDPDVGLLAAPMLAAAEPDPKIILEAYLSSENATENGRNAANFRNDEVDQALAVAATSVEPGDRARALETVTRIAAEQLPYLPLFFTSFPIALADGLVYAEDKRSRYAFVQPWLTHISASA